MFDIQSTEGKALAMYRIVSIATGKIVAEGFDTLNAAKHWRSVHLSNRALAYRIEQVEIVVESDLRPATSPGSIALQNLVNFPKDSA
jgi:hypothetical protein